MPVRRGHVAPKTTIIETIIRKFDTHSEYFFIAFFLYISVLSQHQSFAHFVTLSYILLNETLFTNQLCCHKKIINAPQKILERKEIVLSPMCNNFGFHVIILHFYDISFSNIYILELLHHCTVLSNKTFIVCGYFSG
jgi:hypothetical protein